MKTTAVIFVSALLLAAGPTGAIGQGESSQDGKALFEKKCNICHSAGKATSKRKTAKDWEATVVRMKDKNGAPVSAEEAKSIIAHLAKHHGK